MACLPRVRLLRKSGSRPATYWRFLQDRCRAAGHPLESSTLRPECPWSGIRFSFPTPVPVTAHKRLRQSLRLRGRVLPCCSSYILSMSCCNLTECVIAHIGTNSKNVVSDNHYILTLPTLTHSVTGLISKLEANAVDAMPHP